MENPKAICQFCLQRTSNTVSENVSNIVRIFFPFKHNKIKNSSICKTCSSNLESTYRFVSTANENNSKVLDATIENEDAVCQTCLTPVVNPHVYLYDHFDNVTAFSIIQKMLKSCLINLDLGYRQNPVMCDVCWQVLTMSFQFLARCEQTEIKTMRFCRMQQITMIGADDLKKFMECSLDISRSCNDVIDLEAGRDNQCITRSKVALDDIFSDIKAEMDEQAMRGAIIKVEDDSDLNPDSASVHENDNNTIYIKVEDASDPEPNPSAQTENDVKKELYVKMDRIRLRTRKKDDRSEATKPTYKCHLCPYSSKKRYTYNNHLTTHMTLAECARENRLFQCTDCSYRSKRNYGLAQHVRRMHGSPSLDKPTETKPVKLPNKVILKCRHCKFETNLYVSLIKHALTHKTSRPQKLYKCEVCGYEVKKKSSISRHVLTHSTLRELSKHNKLYQCHICDHKTKRKDSLPQHIRSQHGHLVKEETKVDCK